MEGIDFNIVLCQESTIYFPGQVINGHVVANLNEAMFSQGVFNTYYLIFTNSYFEHKHTDSYFIVCFCSVALYVNI